MGAARFLCAALCALLPAGAARAEPALWAVKGAHATIYLFGTVHALKKTTKWKSPKITTAFRASGELWEEIEGDDDPAKTGALMRDLGRDDDHPLFTRLSKADITRVDAAATALKIPGGEAALDPLRPWAAALILTVTPIIQAGYDPNSGVDKVLKRDALASGKPLRAFETLEQQMHFLADLPSKVELSMLRETLTEVADGPARLNDMIDSWEAGDVDAIAKLDDEMRTEAPEVYRKLLVERNQRWATAIAGWQAGTGVTFVAVGCGHLAGPDSLQHALEKLGVQAERQ